MMEADSEVEYNIVLDSSKFWEDLKQKLDDELTQDEQEKIAYLIHDTIKTTMYKEKVTIRNTRDLLGVLEQCMFFEDALSVLEHAFGYEDYYPEYEDKSFGHIISDYRLNRKRFGCSNIIGRDAEIRDAIDKLVNTDVQGLWIYGMGGLGKTLLANEISGLLAISRDTTVFKLDLKQVRTTFDVIKSILAKFEIYSTDTDTDTVTIISQLLYQLDTVSYDTCIVLDSIEDVYLYDTEGLNHFLERCVDGSSDTPIKWIITSRINIDADSEISGILQMKLDPLNESSAEQLLKLSIRPIEVAEEKCQRILEMTGRNPLAIRLVSSALKTDWQEDISDNFPFLNIRLQNGMKECIEYAYMSLTEVERTHLHGLSVVETSQFDIDIVNGVLKLEDGKNAFLLMMKLTNYQIVQSPSYGQYCLHPLIFDYVSTRPCNEGVLVKARLNFCYHMITMLDPYIQHIDREYTKAIAKITENAPLLKTLCNVISTSTDVSNNLLTPKVNKLIKYFQDIVPGSQMDKKKFYQNLAKTMLSSGSLPSYIKWKLEEIWMTLDLNYLVEAEKELSVLSEKIHDLSDDTDFNADIKSYFWFMKGKFYRCKLCKEYTKAIECFRESHQRYEHLNDIPACARALNDLGNTYFGKKDFDQALYYHQQAFDLLQSYIENDYHPDLSNYEFNIGTVYFEKANTESDTNKASGYYEKALQVFEKSIVLDENMKMRRTSKHGFKVEAKATALFNLSSNDARKQSEAIKMMKESLKLKIDPFTKPDKNKTLAYVRTGRTFFEWLKNPSNDPGTKQLLLKEALYCLRTAENEITKDKSASLDDPDKCAFISLYKKFASPSFVKHDEVKNIKRFCAWYENDSLSSSSSSSSSSSCDTSEASSTGNDDTDSDDSDKDGGIPDSGIMSTITERQHADQFYKDFVNKISDEKLSYKDTIKRRRSSESD